MPTTNGMQLTTINWITKACHLQWKKVGAEKIFKQSVTKNVFVLHLPLWWWWFKSFSSRGNTYCPEKPVKKYECIGHYKKRVGTCLRKKKDVKRLDGKGRLTDAKIDTFQNYFGIGLRQNVGDIDKMISTCKASMFHAAGYIDNCPKNQNSWCQYQQDMLNWTNSYKGKGGLSLDVLASILHVHNDLCIRENLSKCLHGLT